MDSRKMRLIGIFLTFSAPSDFVIGLCVPEVRLCENCIFGEKKEKIFESPKSIILFGNRKLEVQ